VIPQVDLKAQYAVLKPEIDAAVERVLDVVPRALHRCGDQPVRGWLGRTSLVCSWPRPMTGLRGRSWSFNVASGTETSLAELAQALLRIMGAPLQPEYGPGRKVNPVPRRLADTRKAARRLGLRAQVSVEDGLRRLIEGWCREQHGV
jgi:nucleoside-diphosphate-sugar epimerase